MIAWPFNTPAHLTRFDIFLPEVEGKKLEFFCRGGATCFGMNEDLLPVGEDGTPLEVLSTVPWTPEEKKEMELAIDAYIRSMSCEEDR